MFRRSLLLAGVALPTAAYGQCVTDTPAVDACRGGVRITAPPGVTLDLSFMVPGSMPPGVTFTRASTATYFDGTGTLQTAATNAARWDYDPVTHALRGLLIEPPTTNVLLNSATLGTQTTASLTANPFTLSFYGTGTIVYSGAASGTLVGTGAFPQRVSRTFTPTAGTLTCTVTGSVLNAQLEQESYSTSYIPTTSVTVARVQDICTVPTAAWYNQNAQTLLQEMYLPYAPGGDVVCGLGDGATFGNSWYFAANTIVSRAGVATANGSAFTPFAVNKIAGSMTVAAIQCCTNAGAVGSAANSVLPPPATLLAIGNAPWSLGGQLAGHVRRVRYWPRVLTNAELQSVTT